MEVTSVTACALRQHARPYTLPSLGLSSYLGCCNKNAINWATSKQKKKERKDFLTFPKAEKSKNKE